MFAAGRGKRFKRALHDSLTADVDPGAGGHLSVHGQTQSLEAVEFSVIGPLADQVRIRN